MDYYQRCAKDCKPIKIKPFKAADLEPKTELAEDEIRQEIEKQLKQQNYWGMLAKKWNRSDYRVRKDQMFQRFQQENEERKYQECICRTEQEKCKRERQICHEENFAEAMKELKNDDVRESAFRKQLHNCCPEIRDLERELRRAYYAKTLYAQRLEGEAKKLEEKMRQMEMHEMLMEKLQKMDLEQQQKELEEYQKKMEYNQSLTNQLQDATSKLAKQQNEFAQDKAMVDEIIKNIEQEELDDLMEKQNKIKLYRDEINHFLESREFHRERERARAKEEDQKIKEFINTKEEQMEKFNKLKAERDAAKAGIVAKAIERIMQAQFKNEELEELRRTLYEEELAEQVRQKEIEDREKRQRQMEELRAAEQEARKLRAEKLQADKEEEEEFRKQLMAKFAEDDRLEQLSNQKRRERECEHRRIVHRMINERRALKAQEREKQLEARNCFDEETERRKQLIDQERLKLLKEHGPKLLGFIPRGVIKSQEELELLGEPFVSYYRDQPKLQDPTTIDFEPCEEELFKNTKLPPGLKY